MTTQLNAIVSKGVVELTLKTTGLDQRTRKLVVDGGNLTATDAHGRVLCNYTLLGLLGQTTTMVCPIVSSAAEIKVCKDILARAGSNMQMFDDDYANISIEQIRREYKVIHTLLHRNKVN